MKLIDRLIGYFDPARGAARLQARATMDQIDAFTGGPDGPYAAANKNQGRGRINRSVMKENQVPVERLNVMRADSWNLFRDNPYCRKIVRSTESKVIGKGMLPQSLATNDDGSPAVEFRNRAKNLWLAIQSGFDLRGMPGQGGQTFAGLQRLALRATMLGGNALYKLVPVDSAEQLRRDLPVPLVLQLIDSLRLATNLDTSMVSDGHTFHRGIELDTNGQRVRYWLTTVTDGMLGVMGGEAKPFPANEIGHLFLEDDIDQLIGSPWFAPTLIGLRDVGDIEHNYQKATAMASCVVMGVRRPTGVRRFGLESASETQNGTADGTDLTDSDGNTVTKMQPGMVVDLGKDGALESVSPNIQTGNAEAFIGHKLRATACGLPGTKSSTVTGDYRNSSFSSERSADNDCWPEIETLQEWFATGFCQPIFEAVVRAGVLSGYFEGVIDATDFSAAPGRYLAAKWQGPIQLSINPVDDTNAAAMRMHHGLSSLQMECAKVSSNWRDSIRDNVEVREAAAEAKLPPEWINNVYGVDAQDVIAQNIVATNGGQSAQQGALANAQA